MPPSSLGLSLLQHFEVRIEVENVCQLHAVNNGLLFAVVTSPLNSVHLCGSQQFLKFAIFSITSPLFRALETTNTDAFASFATSFLVIFEFNNSSICFVVHGFPCCFFTTSRFLPTTGRSPARVWLLSSPSSDFSRAKKTIFAPRFYIITITNISQNFNRYLKKYVLF